MPKKNEPKKGSSPTNQRFNRIDQKLDQLDQKTDQLDKKIDGVEAKLTEKINGVETRLAAGVARTEGKIDRLKHELMDFIKENTSRILQTVEDFAVQYQKQDRQLVLHGHRLEEHEKRIAAVEEKIR